MGAPWTLFYYRQQADTLGREANMRGGALVHQAGSRRARDRSRRPGHDHGAGGRMRATSSASRILRGSPVIGRPSSFIAFSTR